MSPKVSRQKVAPPAKKVYCRRCRKEKSAATGFYKAVDPVLDTNGYMSVCKLCCNEIYENSYVTVGELFNALDATCKILNVAYIEDVARGVEKRLLAKTSKGQKVTNVFGVYRQTLTGTKNVGADYKTMTYNESTVSRAKEVETPEFEDEQEERTYEELIFEWGKGFDPDTYLWLESKFQQWSSVHKCDTPAEKTLLREIVWKEFEIAKARDEDRGTGGLVKELQELMKTAAVDPAKASTENYGKSHETFSDFISMIEEKEPAEVFGEERDAFKDWQNLERYFRDYVVRPIQNFVTGSKDFAIDDGADGDTLDYLTYDDDD